MSAAATGTSDSMRNISQGKVRALRVDVPPPHVQREVAAEISRQLASATRLGDDVKAIAGTGSALRRSILTTAFSGRLVPQDPSDEPASALLERIAVERAAVKPSNREKEASL